MRYFIAVMTALTLLVIGAPSATAENDIIPALLNPSKSALKPSVLKPTVRKHTLVIAPLYYEKEIDQAVMRNMFAQAKNFWEREVPGMILTAKFLKPKRYSGVCDSVINGAQDQAAKMTSINPYQFGKHVVTYAQECNFGGYASMRPGSGKIFVGSADEDGTILAHEFGHNLYLNHSNYIQCKSQGKSISISRNCKEIEYGNPYSIMGNSPLDSSMRLGAVGQTLLTGRTLTLSPRRPTVSLSTDGKGNQVAHIPTKLGAVYISALAVSGREFPSLALVELLRKRGASLVTFPELPDQPESGLMLGDVWNVPGTQYQVAVTNATSKNVDLRLTKRQTVALAPAPLIVPPTSGSFPAGIPWILSWESDVNPLAFIVKAGDQVLGRVSGKARSFEFNQEPVSERDDANVEKTTFSITAVSDSGGRSESAPVTLVMLRPEIRITNSLGDDVEVTQPFNLSWSLDPAIYKSLVKNWRVSSDDFELILPPDQFSLTLNPVEFSDGNIRVDAIGIDGELIVSEYYYVNKPWVD